MRKGKAYIGTSGWNYAGWIGSFYPEPIKSKDLLAEYGRTFDTVELNNSHYQLPKPKAAHEWYKQSPADFVFACKAHRYVTHTTRLKAEEGIGMMLDAFAPLGDKLGPILYQLPGGWNPNFERLQHYLRTLPRGPRYAFEFRDQRWLCDDVYALLEQRDIALCFYDYRGFRSPEVVTADFAYLRLHGPHPEPYGGSYSEADLDAYARKIAHWQSQGLDVYVYFDNDQDGYAPHNARDLLAKVRRDR